MATVVRFSMAKVRGFARDPGGPIVNDLHRRGRRGAAEARRTVGVDSGALQRSIRYEVRYAKPSVRVLAGAGLKGGYHWYWLKGTRPHEIRPRRKKALRFNVGGVEIIVASVQHPGTEKHQTIYIFKTLRAMAD